MSKITPPTPTNECPTCGSNEHKYCGTPAKGWTPVSPLEQKELETLKRVYREVIGNGSHTQGSILHWLATEISKITGVNIPKDSSTPTTCDCMCHDSDDPMSYCESLCESCYIPKMKEKNISTPTTKELTVKEVLNWSDKHRKLTSEGARLVHIKQLLTMYDERKND